MDVAYQRQSLRAGALLDDLADAALLGLLAVLAVLFLALPDGLASASERVAAATAAPAAQLPLALTIREQGLVEAMNHERILRGLPPFEVSAQLTAVARDRSSDMVERKYFSHFSPSGQTVFSLLGDRTIRFSAAGENLAIAWGNETESASRAIRSLMGSANHRSAILEPRFSTVGVGAVTDSQGATVFTTIFIGEITP